MKVRLIPMPSEGLDKTFTSSPNLNRQTAAKERADKQSTDVPQQTTGAERETGSASHGHLTP
ncbi:hypothetical protein ACVIW0_001972 [Bradyrhizobium sp. USDA 4454]